MSAYHPYGFRWGPITVIRLMSLTRGKREFYSLGVETDFHKVEVYSSRNEANFVIELRTRMTMRSIAAELRRQVEASTCPT